MPYHYNPHVHVKIWLSCHPEEFINFENLIRLNEMRENNPKDMIYLVYDSTLLNENSLTELHKYCQENRIFPVDADAFKDSLEEDNEKILYHFYKDEITHLKEGGNPAGASDILRLLPFVFKLGTYTDFDSPVDTTMLPEKIIVETPLLLNIGSLSMGKQFIFSNNDYIAVVDSVAAKAQIEKIQQRFINKLKKYETDFIHKTQQALEDCLLGPMLTDFMANRAESLYLKKLEMLTLRIGEKSSRELRGYIAEIMHDKNKFLDFYKLEETEPHASVIKRLRMELNNQLNIVKCVFFGKEYREINQILLQDDDNFVAFLMKRECSLYIKAIVVSTTGPIEIAHALFNSSVVENEEFENHVKPFSYKQYGLQEAFQSKNSIPVSENIFNMLTFLGADIGELSDSSWLEDGRKLQESRQEKLIDRQKKLASELPESLKNARKDIEKYFDEKKMQSCPLACFGYFKNSGHKQEREILQQILQCYDQDNWFNINAFKNILTSEIYSEKKEVFFNTFSKDAQKIINDLEQLCHDAVVYRLSTTDVDNLEQKMRFS